MFLSSVALGGAFTVGFKSYRERMRERVMALTVAKWPLIIGVSH